MCVCVGVQAHVVGIGADCSFPLCLSSPHCCSMTSHHCSVETGVCGGGCRRHNGLFMFWKEEFKARLKAESRQKSSKCQYSGASHLGLCSLRPPSPCTWLPQNGVSRPTTGHKHEQGLVNWVSMSGVSTHRTSPCLCPVH